MENGDSIIIEERPEIEACTVRGVIYDQKAVEEKKEERKKVVTVLFTSTNCRVWK